MELHVMEAQTQDELDQAVAVFVSARPRLVAIAYRILGTVNEAEDVVQEVWLRWHDADRAVVVSPTAFLATTTTRLALNVAQSARRRRETYVDRLLPEPVDTDSDPQTKAERGESVEQAVQVLLEKLTGNERARVRPSRGVRLPVPPDLGDPAASDGQHAADRDAGPQPHGRSSTSASRVSRASSFPAGLPVRGPGRQPRRPGSSSWPAMPPLECAARARGSHALLVRSCFRDWMPSFVKTLRRCHSTVWGLMNSWAPISGLVSPSPASLAICAS